jgi:hypothetical protein
MRIQNRIKNNRKILSTNLFSDILSKKMVAYTTAKERCQMIDPFISPHFPLSLCSRLAILFVRKIVGVTAAGGDARGIQVLPGCGKP